MKQLFKNFFTASLLAVLSCNTQRLVVGVSDAKKLETNKDSFIGKPLRKVLSEIKPTIKFVYGNPENNSGHVTGGTYLTFYFVTKEEGKNRISKNNIPTHVTINFQLEQKNDRKPLPVGGLTEWTKINTKEYGDMIILNIRVSGEN